MLKKAGATEVHVRISSPPFLYPCYYGTDVPTGDQLIARNNTIDQIRQMIGADSLGYLALDRLNDIIGKGMGYCDACFTGNYPTKLPKCVSKEEKK
jgi:amidophosphoribosyltransferase